MHDKEYTARPRARPPPSTPPPSSTPPPARKHPQLQQQPDSLLRSGVECARFVHTHACFLCRWRICLLACLRSPSGAYFPVVFLFCFRVPLSRADYFFARATWHRRRAVSTVCSTLYCRSAVAATSSNHLPCTLYYCPIVGLLVFEKSRCVSLRIVLAARAPVIVFDTVSTFFFASGFLLCSKYNLNGKCQCNRGRSRRCFRRRPAWVSHVESMLPYAIRPDGTISVLTKGDSNKVSYPITTITGTSGHEHLPSAPLPSHYPYVDFMISSVVTLVITTTIAIDVVIIAATIVVFHCHYYHRTKEISLPLPSSLHHYGT